MPHRPTVPAPMPGQKARAMGSHGHFIKRCKYCNTLLGQCRCMGPKPTVYETCGHCQKLIALGQPLYPASQPIKAFMCGIVSMSGPNREPLACAYPPGHDGDHSWATLPTFVPGNLGHIESAGEILPTMYSAEVQELIQAGIEASDGTPRTARLRTALEAFGVR